jgi:hypothetical protein
VSLFADIPCPHCGVQIRVNFGANLVQTGSANDVQNEVNSEIAQELIEGFSSKKRSYNQGYDQDFLAFWGVYPRKRSKGVAYKTWSKQVQFLCKSTGANRVQSISAILHGAMRYRDDPNRLDEYTQHAATWLNAAGWEDEPLPTRLSPNGQRPDPPRPMTSGEMDQYIDHALGKDIP